ncbi:hypothetical protein [Chitinophaga sp. 212800008-4]|uniref:hypothetical protein n=1 Tax=unclassified Chitinophaga TaxID=2619133 RepID=UPI0030D4039F
MKTTVGLIEPGQYGFDEMNIGEMEAVNGGGLITDIVIDVEKTTMYINTYTISVLNNMVAYYHSQWENLLTYISNFLSSNSLGV